MWRISKKFILSSQKGFLSEESNFLCVCLVRLKVERGLILYGSLSGYIGSFV
jgi:hypothetical protein